jgi:hypothetical protein
VIVATLYNRKRLALRQEKTALGGRQMQATQQRHKTGSKGQILRGTGALMP